MLITTDWYVLPILNHVICILFSRFKKNKNYKENNEHCKCIYGITTSFVVIIYYAVYYFILKWFFVLSLLSIWCNNNYDYDKKKSLRVCVIRSIWILYDKLLHTKNDSERRLSCHILWYIYIAIKFIYFAANNTVVNFWQKQKLLDNFCFWPSEIPTIL